MKRRIIIVGAFVLLTVSYNGAGRCSVAAQTNTADQSAPTPKLQSESSESRTVDNDKIRRAEWVAIGINGFIALVILWQAWTYNQQRKIMERQFKAMVVGERAYLGATGMGMSGLAIGQTPSISLVIQNAGRTPAWKVKAPGKITIEPAGKRPAPERIKSKFVGDGVLAAGATRIAVYQFEMVCDSSLIHRIQNGIVSVFIQGDIYYEDAWGEQHSSVL